MKFGHHILKYKEEILRDLGRLIAIPSVCTDSLPGKPFGEAPAQALACILDIAKELDFETTNVGNYAGDARYGNGSAYIDVLTHVDVVPAGDGWNTDPYCLTEKDGCIFGRGVADDKGPAIISLYCLKALKDAGIQGNYVLRTVFGAGEEIASDDLEHYYKEYPYPVMGFTPDCTYGICHSEKGIMRIEFLDSAPIQGCIKSFHAGLAVNAVPAKAEAEISCTPKQHQILTEIADSRHFTLTRHNDITIITALGCAAHGSQPEEGVNAAALLIDLLVQVFPREKTGKLISFLSDCISKEYNGALMGIQMEDEPSGPLTLNLGLVDIHDGYASASIDIRYPVTKEMDTIMEIITQKADSYHLQTALRNHDAPLYLPKDSALIQLLKRAYESVMNEPCTVFSTGGGTYARGTNNTTVAFGPVFPSDPSNNVHNCNEYINLEKFFLHAQICLEAMYLMFTGEN